tara:strand:+ start:773 stop:1042 length:270 start_codon:yes stop_codon:yes gene_type:complete
MNSQSTKWILENLIDKWTRQQIAFEARISAHKDIDSENDYAIDSAIATMLQARIDDLKHAIDTIDSVEQHTDKVREMIMNLTKPNNDNN